MYQRYFILTNDDNSDSISFSRNELVFIAGCLKYLSTNELSASGIEVSKNLLSRLADLSIYPPDV